MLSLGGGGRGQGQTMKLSTRRRSFPFNVKVNLKPALFSIGCVPAREPSADCIPTVPYGTPTVMWTSFCFLRYVGTLQEEREKERRKRRKLLVVQDFMPLSTIAQKIYIYILTFLLQNMKSTLCILSWCSSYNNIGVTGLYTSSRSTEK